MKITKHAFVLIALMASLSGCSKPYPIPLSLYQEFQTAACENRQHPTLEGVQQMADVTARFNTYLLTEDFKKQPDFARIHALRLSFVMDSKNCGQPFPTTADFQDAGSSTAPSPARAEPKAEAATPEKVQPVAAEAANATAPAAQPSPENQVSPTQPAAAEAAPVVPAPDAPQKVSASFDCNKASSAQEKLICSTAALGEADIKLNAAYKAAAQKAADPAELKKDQLAWMKNVRNACKDEQCLLEAMSKRTAALAN